MLEGLGEALGYFTIVPTPRRSPEGPPSPRAVAWLPLIGMVVGASSGAVACATQRVAPRPLANALGYSLPIVLTGALHVDGFMDTCDALFAPVPPERRRDILRDPHHGTFAIVAQCIATVLGFASVAALPAARLPVALALAEGSGRLAALVVARDAAHRTGTAGSAFSEKPSAVAVALQGGVLTALALRLGGAPLGAGCAAIQAGAIPMSRGIARAFGGSVSGDVYGFTIVTATLATLALTASVARCD